MSKQKCIYIAMKRISDLNAISIFNANKNIRIRTPSTFFFLIVFIKNVMKKITLLMLRIHLAFEKTTKTNWFNWSRESLE